MSPPTTVNIEIASAIQNSTRELMTGNNLPVPCPHCLVLWISSATSTKKSDTSGAVATEIATSVLNDLTAGGATVHKLTQVVSEHNAKDQKNWRTVDAPDFTDFAQGPFYVRFDFTLQDDAAKPIVLTSLPNKPTLAGIEANAYAGKVNV